MTEEFVIRRDPEEVVDFEFEDDGSVRIYERYLYLQNGTYGSVYLSKQELTNFLTICQKKNLIIKPMTIGLEKENNNQ